MFVKEDDRTSPPAQEAGNARRGFRFPSAFTVLFGVTVAVWLLAFIVPTGRYAVDAATGRPVPGSYEATDVALSFTDRLMELFMAPVNGLYGVADAETGWIGPYESGELYGAAGVFLFVLAIGIFITVAIRTGAIDAGVARLAQRFGTRGPLAIVVLMLFFAVGGTTIGMAEETLGFYALVIPLMLSLGYDRMVAVGTILVGATVGVLASTVNPFATGVGSGAADISIGDGIGTRLVMWLVLVPVGMWWVLRYAKKVKADPKRSLVGRLPGDEEIAARGAGPVAALTSVQKTVLGIVALTFAFMIFSLVPWAQVIHGPEADSFAWQLDWYFPELAALFLVMALVVGLLGRLGEKGLTDTVVKGAGDFIGVGLIIVLARGVTVLMNNAEISDTILNTMETAVTSTGSGLFAALVYMLNIPLAFLVPSTSGHAALAMPILAPLADFAGVERHIVVTAFQSASGVVNLITPTSAVVMGGLALAKVRYDHYLRFVAPLLLILLILGGGLIALFAVL